MALASAGIAVMEGCSKARAYARRCGCMFCRWSGGAEDSGAFESARLLGSERAKLQQANVQAEYMIEYVLSGLMGSCGHAWCERSLEAHPPLQHIHSDATVPFTGKLVTRSQA